MCNDAPTTQRLASKYTLHKYQPIQQGMEVLSYNRDLAGLERLPLAKLMELHTKQCKYIMVIEQQSLAVMMRSTYTCGYTKIC